MKKQTISTLLIVVVTFMMTGLLLAEGTERENLMTGESGLGWQQNAMRKSVVYVDPIEMNGEVSFNSLTNVLLIKGGMSTGFCIIDCCRAYRDEHSWCNFNADDVKCKN